MKPFLFLEKIVKSKEFLHPKKKTNGGWGARRLSSMKKILKFWDIFIYKCIYFNFFKKKLGGHGPNVAPSLCGVH